MLINDVPTLWIGCTGIPAEGSQVDLPWDQATLGCQGIADPQHINQQVDCLYFPLESSGVHLHKSN